MEMRGIDPRTSRLLSERSTIWATSPYSSSFELALNKTHEISAFHLYRVVNSFPLSANTNQNYRILKNVLEMRGIDPRTSRMLSERSTIWATSPYSSSFELALNKTHEISAFHLYRVVNSFPLSANTNQNYRILKNVLEMRGIDPRTSRMLSERSTIWATSP